jgi:hypothetical protein
MRGIAVAATGMPRRKSERDSLSLFVQTSPSKKEEAQQQHIVVSMDIVYFNPQHPQFESWRRDCDDQNDGYACSFCLDSFIENVTIGNANDFYSQHPREGWISMEERNC